jgi:hypothetical protein
MPSQAQYPTRISVSSRTFFAAGSSPTEKLLYFVDGLKNDWIMENIKTSSEIIVKLDNCIRTWFMMAHGSIPTRKKPRLCSHLFLSGNQNKVGELAKCMTFSGGDSKKGGEGKSKSSDGGAKTTKTCCPEWQVTKKGSSITQDGKKYVWCPRHHSKDGSINGLYMPAPHHHDAWAKAKAEKVEKYECSKRDKEGGKGRDGDASPNKKAKTGSQLKLALSDKLTQALVTQHHLSQTKADELFNKVYKEVEEGQEN